MNPIQIPEPGTHRLLYTGDVLEFTLRTGSRGRAFLRTNIGNAAVRRAETISIGDHGVVPAGQDWHDIPMMDEGNGTFSLRLGLIETGHFEAKCFFMPENSDSILWPDGPNVHVNVGPAGYCCANSIYCAFVRQFGPNRTKSVTVPADAETSAAEPAAGGRTSSGRFGRHKERPERGTIPVRRKRRGSNNSGISI